MGGLQAPQLPPLSLNTPLVCTRLDELRLDFFSVTRGRWCRRVVITRPVLVVVVISSIISVARGKSLHTAYVPPHPTYLFAAHAVVISTSPSPAHPRRYRSKTRTSRNRPLLARLPCKGRGPFVPPFRQTAPKTTRVANSVATNSRTPEAVCVSVAVSTYRSTLEIGNRIARSLIEWKRTNYIQTFLATFLRPL